MSEFGVATGASEGRLRKIRLRAAVTAGASSSTVGPDSSNPMRLRKRVEFVKLSEDVYSSVLDELVVLS